MDDFREFLNTLRYDFGKKSLSREDAGNDPFALFALWISEAVKEKNRDPNAMVLSTVSPEGKPSSRVVLLRNFSKDGFVFYTNYNSRKGNEIQKNPFACLNFFWPELERQVRIEGMLYRQPDAESDSYFQSRPRESQISAWISEQSRPVNSREELDLAYATMAKKFEGRDIPRPPFWGGYVLKPEVIEFWQGRPGRLHDRILFNADGAEWKVERLAP